MAWFALSLAVVTEILWALSLKWASSLGNWQAAAVPIALALAMRGLPAGMTYALWTGAGTVGVVLGGALFFGDKVSLPQLFFIALIIIGSVGTKFFSSQA